MTEIGLRACVERPDRTGRRLLDLLASKARWAWLAARLVVDRYPESAASRAYYALHHALRRRLGSDLPRGRGGVTDAGVLVRAGLGPSDVPATSSLYHLRHRADYDRRVPVSTEEARTSVRVCGELLGRLGIDTRLG